MHRKFKLYFPNDHLLAYLRSTPVEVMANEAVETPAYTEQKCAARSKEYWRMRETACSLQAHRARTSFRRSRVAPEHSSSGAVDAVVTG